MKQSKIVNNETFSATTVFNIKLYNLFIKAKHLFKKMKQKLSSENF